MADKNLKVADSVSGEFYVDMNCVGCGLCCDTAQECFKMNDNSGTAYVYKQPSKEDEKEKCESAKEDCPVNSIGNDG